MLHHKIALRLTALAAARYMQEAVYDSTERPVVDVYRGQAFAELSPTGKPRALGAAESLVDSK
ncbi:hypothetical protein JK364_23510 [Streptomyces sp. 110]|uniref:Uncharacterized protein n=1 Tax=Streptomyces endocoffeicus TaxID=2898945 RepID=A0ABS1PSD2_9ACTN|nr:hypothetical protein [Streptomyces endocoffeicus]MBL1115341.1 hypothetical protein [Streptomyces endocoffeicus]